MELTLNTIADALTRDQRSFLLYAETCAVDHGGLLEGERMNAADIDAGRWYTSLGFMLFGCIPASHLPAPGQFSTWKPTYWCALTAEGWALAHLLRQQRAKRRGPYAEDVWAEVAARDLLDPPA